MKKLLMYCFISVVAISLTACSQAQIVSIPSGYTNCDEHWDEKGFQDYTDYCKYVYSSEDRIMKSTDYIEISQDDVEIIGNYFDNFREWMETENRLDEYDFKNDCINTGDYVRIIKKGNQYEDYTVYFFDVETLTLYYIHTNI